MTWHLPTQIYTMPSVVDLPGDSPPDYSSEHLVSQNDYVFPQSLDHQEPLGGRYNTSSFPYLSPGQEVPGYGQQQYVNPTNTQHQSYRENSFVWIGTNNYYPSSSYDQRYSENTFNPQRQSLRRHSGDRNEKAASRKRRAPTVAQRRAANIRERRRMYNLNEAFDCLRQRIPTFAYEKRLSRIETLRLAISYISFMARIVKGEDPSTLRVSTYGSPMGSSTSLTQPTLRNADKVPALHRCGDGDFDEDRDDDDDEDGEDDDMSEADDDAIDEDSQDIFNQDIQLATSSDAHRKT